jgi:hypothetical protein
MLAFDDFGRVEKSLMRARVLSATVRLSSSCSPDGGTTFTDDLCVVSRSMHMVSASVQATIDTVQTAPQAEIVK